MYFVPKLIAHKLIKYNLIQLIPNKIEKNGFKSFRIKMMEFILLIFIYFRYDNSS